MHSTAITPFLPSLPQVQNLLTDSTRLPKRNDVPPNPPRTTAISDVDLNARKPRTVRFLLLPFSGLISHSDTVEDTQLTSQTLNADGTPKRPMNAFMIFARRRRPQVSAQNQSMRTGEISKILSKEWVSMPAVKTSQCLQSSFLPYY